MGSLAVALFRSAPVERAVVTRMLEAAPHRGTKLNVVLLGKAALGASNHSELTESWLATSDGKAAAFTGSLDNRAELREELARAGVAVLDENPASTVLAAFAAWGDEAPARMRGSFAGVVSDGSSLRCFRDQFGSQTLFFRDDAWAFLTGSEAKQVLAGAGLARRPDVDAATDIFYGRLAERGTALKGVERFPWRSIARVEQHGTASFHRFWDPSGLLESARVSVPEAQERLADLLQQAVGRAVSGNDAIALSGGVDSPTVAAFAAPRHLELGGNPLAAISAVYPDQPSTDERRYTELVAAHLGLPLHTYVQESRPIDDLAFWVDVLDGPWDTFSVPEAAESYRLARELGARRLFTGDLAEQVSTLSRAVFGHLVLHGRWSPAGRWLRTGWVRGRRKALAREAITSLAPAFVAEVYARLRSTHYRTRQLSVVPSWLKESEFPPFDAHAAYGVPARRRWLETQLLALVTGAGTSADASELCAAHVGVQVRRPFADVDVWEFFLSLPAEVKFPDFNPGKKTLVRETMRGRLPDAILDRTDKTVFDDHILAAADYRGLERWLLGGDVRLAGVDYERLAAGLERQDLSVNDIVWAYDLARVHAFLTVVG